MLQTLGVKYNFSNNKTIAFFHGWVRGNVVFSGLVSNSLLGIIRNKG
jgi:hypothetical protein